MVSCGPSRRARRTGCHRPWPRGRGELCRLGDTDGGRELGQPARPRSAAAGPVTRDLVTGRARSGTESRDGRPDASIDGDCSQGHGRRPTTATGDPRCDRATSGALRFYFGDRRPQMFMRSPALHRVWSRRCAGFHELTSSAPLWKGDLHRRRCSRDLDVPCDAASFLW